MKRDALRWLESIREWMDEEPSQFNGHTVENGVKVFHFSEGSMIENKLNIALRDLRDEAESLKQVTQPDNDELKAEYDFEKMESVKKAGAES